ncbi:serine/threonine-protein kinase RIO3-like [Hydractinia symbiolongicarpus]|uniref:serine/threonine-protein kinase RIO3-like n=1 Tax=Hydractinia symbiolongicarpus TaxID=13093 RepID=UPI00254DE06C|nr:serine/threonine-protein kinase RIO3-like [Hydractinia symbiolongicarpus]
MAAKVEPSNTNNTSTCPWAKKKTAEVRAFTDVMDEEFAQQLQNENLNETSQPFVEAVEEFVSKETSSNEATTNDLLLAQMLQLEFDRENDEFVKKLETNYNGTSKVSMSFKNFRTLHPYDIEDVDDTDDDSQEEEEDDEIPVPSGKTNSASEIITKHNSLISERKNAKYVESFPLNFASGDVGKKDIRLPNHVYNKLKTHSMKEERNNMRLHEKQEHATHEKALDENTRLLIYKMVNSGVLQSINGIVSTGKEAVVIHADGGEMEEKPLSKECALKVFKTTLSEFKTREKYIKDDHRFRDRFAKQNPRKIIKLWAEKEFRNLNRMKDAGLNCPHVELLRKHILVMSFIGENRVPAQKLKDARLSKEQFNNAYEQCIQTMKTLYEKCNLIHADLSEYNILWHDSKCFFIDVSQSIEPVHPQAYHFLLRDCRNIINFFNKVGVAEVMKEDELFAYVCGKQLEITNLDEIENECQLQFEKNEELLTYGIDSKNYPFNYHFEQSKQNIRENTDTS